MTQGHGAVTVVFLQPAHYSLWDKEVWNNVCPWLGQCLVLADVLGDGHGLLLLYWEKLMLLTGIIPLCPKPHSEEGAETQLPFSQGFVTFA